MGEVVIVGLFFRDLFHCDLLFIAHRLLFFDISDIIVLSTHLAFILNNISIVTSKIE